MSGGSRRRLACLQSFQHILQKYIPLPASAGLTNNWLGPYLPSPVDQKGFTIKTDHYRGPHRISADWEWQPVYGNLACYGLGYGQVPAFGPEITECHHYNFSTHHVRLNYNWTIQPNMVLNLGLGTN